MDRALARSKEAYKVVRSIPAPKRGEILRQIREALAVKVRPQASVLSINYHLFAIMLMWFCASSSTREMPLARSSR